MHWNYRSGVQMMLPQTLGIEHGAVAFSVIPAVIQPFFGPLFLAGILVFSFGMAMLLCATVRCEVCNLCFGFIEGRS